MTDTKTRWLVTESQTILRSLPFSSGTAFSRGHPETMTFEQGRPEKPESKCPLWSSSKDKGRKQEIYIITSYQIHIREIEMS